MPTLRVELPSAMPWGKYRDQLFENIPRDYLRWVLSSDYCTPDLRNDIESELKRRRVHPSTVEYVTRGQTVHLSIDGDLPVCGSLYTWRGSEHRTTYFPGGRECKRGCFK